jgi:hypothetical protein
MNARAYIAYDTMVVEGYPLTARAVDDAQNQPYSIPFTLTMLVTNYYDYSNIGVTRFPGFGQDINLDALNHELSERRGKFISTTQEVRLKNLLASPGGGILGTLRHGIRSFNDMVSKVGGVTDAIHDVVGGRNVRVPIGIAGFLQSVGAAQVGAGAVRTLTSEGGLGSQFDAATGRFEGLNGSVTLRMPGPSKFAPSWTSKASNGPRGYIHENIDEYPVRKAPQALTQLLSEKDNFNRLVRKHERNVAASQNDAELAKWNLMAEGGGLLGDIADGVAFVKANFGTVMTAAAFVNDPLSIAKASLGIGVGTTSQSRLAGRKDELEKFGVKVSGNASGEKLLGKYIGFKALQTFSALANNIADGIGPSGPAQPASLGDVYNSPGYGSQALTADKDYEAVYGDKDYQPLVDSNAETQASLDESFGNNNAAPDGSDTDPASFDEVYGSGVSSSSVRSPEQINAILQSLQTSSPPSDEDTVGIQGIEDVDTQIDPIV